jgi:hypothetical protein
MLFQQLFLRTRNKKNPPKGHSYEKRSHFTLMKLTPEINFINVLRTAFMHVDPESVKIQSNPQFLFTLWGSTCAKAAHRTLMKLTPGITCGNLEKQSFRNVEGGPRQG